MLSSIANLKPTLKYPIASCQFKLILVTNSVIFVLEGNVSSQTSLRSWQNLACNNFVSASATRP